MASGTYFKGITIRLGGDTSGLDDALVSVNKSISATTKYLTSLNKDLKLDPTNVTLLTEKQKLLADAISQTESKLKTLKTAKEQIEAKGNSATEEEKNALSQLNTEIGRCEAQLKKYNTELKATDESALKAKTGLSTFKDTFTAILANEAVQTGLSVIKTSLQAIGSAIKSVLSTGIEYNKQLESYTASFTAMTGSAEEATNVLNRLKTITSSSTFGLDSLAQATQSLISTGIAGEDATKTIEALASAIAYTGGGNDELTRMASNLQQVKNVGKATATDIKQFAMAGIDVYGILSDYTGKSVEEIQNLDISYEMLASALEQASSEGGKYFGALETQMGTLNGQTTKLTNNFKEFAGVLSSDVSSALSQTFLPIINDTLSAMTSGMEENGVQGMVDALVGGVQDMASAISKELPTMIQAGGQIVLGLLKGIVQALPTIAPVAFDVIFELVNQILLMLPEIIECALEIIIALANGIAEALPELIPTIIEVINTIVMTLLEHIDEIINCAINLIIALINGLMEALPQLVSYLPTIITTIVQVLLDNLPIIVEGAMQIIIAIITGLIEALPELVTYVPEILTAIVDGVMACISKIWDLGKNIVEGIWKGISDSWEWLKNKIGEWCGWIMDKVKSFFGIASPSKVFANIIGKNLALGISEGFGDTMPTTINDMKKSLKGLNGEVESSMNATINPSLSTRPVTMQINFSIDNSGKDITDEDINKWGNSIANVVNERLGVLM